MIKHEYFLVASGAISALISILQVSLALRPALYRHISTGQESSLAQMAEQGSTPTTVATIALLSNVSTVDEFLSSLGIVIGLDRLRRDEITLDEYVNKYGHRGLHEVERYFARPAENPIWIDEQLDGLERTRAEVETLLQEQRTRYEAALKNLQKVASQEFDSFLKRIKEATSQIPIRKNAYQKYSDLPEYPTILVGCFDPFTWAADPNRRTDIYDANDRLMITPYGSKSRYLGPILS